MIMAGGIISYRIYDAIRFDSVNNEISYLYVMGGLAPYSTKELLSNIEEKGIEFFELTRKQSF